MAKEKEELFITEISEEDFRKLNLVAYARGTKQDYDENGRECYSIVWMEISMNSVLDFFIKHALEAGYPNDLDGLQTPFTIAIHKENGPAPRDYYLDKYTNLLGPATYIDASCVRHLYSTRDYFECMQCDYFRIPKRDTKAIYRIHLDKKWAAQFVLKHKKVILDQQDKNHWIEGIYDLDPKNDEWVLRYKQKVMVAGDCTTTMRIEDEEEE